MWFGDIYLKPLYLLAIIAAVILIAVIFIVKKLIGIVITAIILCVFVFGGNKFLLNEQAKSVAQYMDMGKNAANMGLEKIQNLINKEDLSVRDDEVKMKIDGKWYDMDFIKKHLSFKNGSAYVNINGTDIKVESEAIYKFLGEIFR